MLIEERTRALSPQRPCNMTSRHAGPITESSVEHLEEQQARLTNYNKRAGRGLLYALPLLLVVLTALSLNAKVLPIDPSLLPYVPSLLLYIFIAVLLLFAINTLILGRLAGKTKAAFTRRLDLERQKGRPLDSLQGFVAIKSNVNRTIATVRGVFILSLLVLLLYAGYVIRLLNTLPPPPLPPVDPDALSTAVAYLGLGLALVCFGASLLVKSISMDVTSVTGLSDFYTPSSHELLLENFFGDVFRGHLDPIARLKYDEFTEAVRRCLRSDFIDGVMKDEPNESPVALAVEKLLYLHYMEYSGVLTHQKVLDEIGEFMALDTEHYHPDKGAKIGGRQYFNTHDIFRVLHLIESTTPAFFDLVDRLQLELVDNIPIMAQDPVYIDAAAEEVCVKDGECHFLLVLFNNAAQARDYTVRIGVSGLEPNDLRLKVSAEGRGDFAIPTEPIPLVSETGIDVAHVLATVLKNSVALWVTLEPREIGIQTLQVFIEDSSGRVVEGKTMPIEVIRNVSYLVKKMTSGLSIIAGAATPALRALIPGTG